MIRRLLFVVFFCLGGFLYYIPKWILVGTKGGRERRQILHELRVANARAKQESGQPLGGLDKIELRLAELENERRA